MFVVDTQVLVSKSSSERQGVSRHCPPFIVVFFGCGNCFVRSRTKCAKSRSRRFEEPCIAVHTIPPKLVRIACSRVPPRWWVVRAEQVRHKIDLLFSPLKSIVRVSSLMFSSSLLTSVVGSEPCPRSLRLRCVRRYALAR